MAQIYIKYNPYRLETTVKVNGKDVLTDSILYKVTKGKRLQEWIGDFPKMLREELNTSDFSLEYYGTALDWDDFKNAFEQAQKGGLIKISDMKYIACENDDDINEKIINIFHDLQNGPVDDFNDPKLIQVLEAMQNSIFPINVIATMSSGKSTLINSLLGQKLMPSKNEACTAIITRILDSDDPNFSAIVYDQDENVMKEVPHLTYETMDEINEDANVFSISAKGDIPFLDSNSTALMLVDTPGPNNAQNQAHKNTTYRAINNDSNSLVLYVLNGTQLSTNDDASLLRYVSEQMKKGGKQVRDRFLFVINKMDQYNPEEENIEKVILSAKRYLASYGIEDPQLFPCSAFTALNIRTYLDDIDIDNLTRTEEKKLPLAARDTLSAIDRFIEYPEMHLETYSTLSPSAQEDLNYRLNEAIEKGDTKEQALIHCGIYSIEAAITAYVKKYAKTKKIKDLVETFKEVLESKETLFNAKTRVAEDEEAAKAVQKRADAIMDKIQDGEEAKTFSNQIDALDSSPEFEEKVYKLEEKILKTSSKFFEPYGQILTSRSEAKHLVKQFTTMSSNAIAELTSDLESIINNEIVDTGNSLLKEYSDKLTKFDDTAANDEHLDFQTVDLIKGELTTMKENTAYWTTDQFATETVDNLGKTTYETNTYYVKVGQEEEEVMVGSHQEKIGTKKVKTGSHQEKVGTKKVEKSGFWSGVARFFDLGGYTTEDVYETVDDYRDEDVYKTVNDYETVMRDIFEEKTEQKEHFKITVLSIQKSLISKLERNLDEGIENTLQFSKNQINVIKENFKEMFKKLDASIIKKYEELNQCAVDVDEKEKSLKENKQILEWIEKNINEINSIIDL